MESRNDEIDIYDDVCAICDNGGDLICCEGKCLRAFHATSKSARSAKSYCTSLKLPTEEVDEFICLNCSHEQHQCFVCKELGSSNISSGAEVFCCSLATCGHFYHPRCVAQLLKEENDIEAHDLEESIAVGEPFTCPAHKCHKCQQEENEEVEDLQFAICRRCPTSYHRKCLPKKILFDSEVNDEVDVTKAWNDLLPKSCALIFCLKHKMDKRLHTPQRNIKFPKIDRTKKNEEVGNTDCTHDDQRTMRKPSFRKRENTLSQSEPMKKRLKKNLPINVERDYYIPVDEDEQTPAATPMESEEGSFTSLDADSRNRILAMVKEVDSSVEMNNIRRQNIGNEPFAQVTRKVEECSKTVQLAWKKLDEGCTIEDAMADCEPGDIDQILNLKDMLKVHLAPFIGETSSCSATPMESEDPVDEDKQTPTATPVESEYPVDEDKETPTATPMESEDRVDEDKQTPTATPVESEDPLDEDKQTPTATPMKSEDENFTSLDNTGTLSSDQARDMRVEEGMKVIRSILETLERGCRLYDEIADNVPRDFDELWKLKVMIYGDNSGST